MFCTKEEMRRYRLNKLVEGLACAGLTIVTIIVMSYMLFFMG